MPQEHEQSKPLAMDRFHIIPYSILIHSFPHSRGEERFSRFLERLFSLPRQEWLPSDLRHRLPHMLVRKHLRRALPPAAPVVSALCQRLRMLLATRM